jgi:hypothetical protein
VVALVAITYLVVRELPEILDVIEDVLFVVTGSEWDLAGAMAVDADADADADPSTVRADGGGD